MAEKVGNKNSQRSKKLIKNAFIELCVDKAIDKITVTDIINSAEISRATFYAHYSDINCLLDSIEIDTVEKVNNHLLSFGVDNAIDSPESYFRSAIELLTPCLDVFKKISVSDNAKLFYERFSEVIKENIVKLIEDSGKVFSETGIVKFSLKYNAISSVIFEWLREKIRVPYTILIGTIINILSDGDQNCFIS